MAEGYTQLLKSRYFAPRSRLALKRVSSCVQFEKSWKAMQSFHGIPLLKAPSQVRPALHPAHCWNLRGLIAGDLTLEPNSVVELRGTVSGSVTNLGAVLKVLRLSTAV
jgi:hypothetical protein